RGGAAAAAFAGAAGAVRLRVRPQRHGQPVHGLRAAAGLAGGPGDAAGPPGRCGPGSARNGTATLFMVSEPLLGWRAVQVTQRRTAKDFAEVLRWLVEEVHPDAEKVVLVLDNLNTHTPASLYEAFAPEQARRIAERVEWHYTPKHGSWLNMAEIEFGALTKECLDRRRGARARGRAGGAGG